MNSSEEPVTQISLLQHSHMKY